MKIDLSYVMKLNACWGVFQKIYAIILDVEKKAHDGEITPEERATIATDDIMDVLHSINVTTITKKQVDAMIDFVVALFNAVGIFTHKK